MNPPESSSRPARPQRLPEPVLFGETPSGERVQAFTLVNSSGASVRVIERGAALQSLYAPDRDGNLEDLVLGYDQLAGYLGDRSYFGAVIGRVANRIGGACFTLNGEQYRVSANEDGNSLHGGVIGFDQAIWSATPLRGEEGGDGLRLTHLSPAGDQGYPGTLRAEVIYTWTDSHELTVDYLATTDRPTPVNLTQHSYFNLAGAGSGTVLGHQLRLQADHFTPVDVALIPTGELRPVQGTPFDFRQATAIGARIGSGDEQLQLGEGYDHNWVLNGAAGTLRLVAEVYEPGTGRTLEVLTTEPGLQFYSGNFLDGVPGKGGRSYGYRGGFCLETQHFPDTPNQPHFPTVTLHPGEERRSRTVFRFGVRA